MTTRWWLMVTIILRYCPKKIAIQGPGGIRDHARGAGATLCAGVARWPIPRGQNGWKYDEHLVGWSLFLIVIDVYYNCWWKRKLVLIDNGLWCLSICVDLWYLFVVPCRLHFILQAKLNQAPPLQESRQPPEDRTAPEGTDPTSKGPRVVVTLVHRVQLRHMMFYHQQKSMHLSLSYDCCWTEEEVQNFQLVFRRWLGQTRFNLHLHFTHLECWLERLAHQTLQRH